MIKKYTIIRILRSEYGINLKSSQQLNRVLYDLGIIEGNPGQWVVSRFGLQFSPYRSPVISPAEWNEEIVDYIAHHI